MLPLVLKTISFFYNFRMSHNFERKPKFVSCAILGIPEVSEKL